jgi:hypothetical protein
MILVELCRICGYNRKDAIRLLNADTVADSSEGKHRSGRKAIYQHPELIAFLKRLWLASNLACSKRLKAMIPLWLPHDELLPEHLRPLALNISAATIDRKRRVHYTRSREYHKNDNAHVEGKNWTLIRQYLGYDRFEDQRMVALLNDLYTNQWRLLLNFFLPSVKLISKHRIKSKIVKRYDRPQTPYERLLASKTLSPSKQQANFCLNPSTPSNFNRLFKKKIRTILQYATPPHVQLKQTA